MRPPSRLDRILGTAPIETLGRKLEPIRLRVLAYHGVADAAAFAAHVEHLSRYYNPVSGSDVSEWLLGASSLPEDAVWLTFDDGRPDVVDCAMPLLKRWGMPATIFVCPGLFPAGSRFWQTEVLAALAVGGAYRFEGRDYYDRDLVVRLKGVRDECRREVVDELRGRLDGWQPMREDAVSEAQVLRWLDAGLEVGNHTWSHPCMDQCDPDEQHRQIVRAHRALTDLLGSPPFLFAYPNGDWTPDAEQVLHQLGYKVAPVFDHRFVSATTSPLRLSRLRIDSDASLDRLRAVLSGVHPTLFHARNRFRTLMASD